jgi:predicted NUDIX family NTP pyrophosphohydrolase
MATAKASEKKTEGEKLVEVYIPLMNKDNPDLMVSINDTTWLMPRGRSHRVPEHVAYEIKRAQRAEMRQMQNQQELLDKAKQPAAN